MLEPDVTQKDSQTPPTPPATGGEPTETTTPATGDPGTPPDGGAPEDQGFMARILQSFKERKAKGGQPPADDGGDDDDSAQKTPPAPPANSGTPDAKAAQIEDFMKQFKEASEQDDGDVITPLMGIIQTLKSEVDELKGTSQNLKAKAEEQSAITQRQTSEIIARSAEQVAASLGSDVTGIDVAMALQNNFEVVARKFPGEKLISPEALRYAFLIEHADILAKDVVSSKKEPTPKLQSGSSSAGGTKSLYERMAEAIYSGDGK